MRQEMAEWVAFLFHQFILFNVDKITAVTLETSTTIQESDIEDAGRKQNLIAFPHFQMCSLQIHHSIMHVCSE
jgi:hypothetical protein